ncbi:MAG TPA: vitamin B12-dependent ribonucleotide reductase, partial [Phycisphaerales bacterium]|nr:vitamin B12-dependent ribonucleotide reductase [Phycisphaerales bacterium]
NMDDLLGRAVSAWDDALALGEKHGFRNAQVTVIAPTGTIGLLMDCDTTGVEPDFALVKFKKLAGGGYFKIANNSVRPALRALGYQGDQIDEIMTSLLGTLDLDVPMPAAEGGDASGITFAQWLRGRGATEADIEKITAQLPGVFELKFAFSAWGLGDGTLERLGIDPASAKADPAFDGLRAMGLSATQAEELNRLVCGTQTVEGAPHLRDEHLPVFDCASKCGKIGTRFIAPEGHIRMMAAAQPFISGAISKTINLPHEATVDDIKACYRLSWELGLKANALYRDRCKLSQPLNAMADADIEDEDADELAEALEEVAEDLVVAATAAAAGDAAVAIEIKERIVHRPMRRRLSDTRRSITHKFNVAGHEGYLTVGLYDDGMPGELFITMAKEGSTIGGLMDSLGTATSVALQYGVPLNSLVKKFTHQRFEPAGMTTNKDIPFAKSLVDYIFRWLGMQFLPGYREANAPGRGEKAPRSATDLGSARTGVPRINHGGDQWMTPDTDVTRRAKAGEVGSRISARAVAVETRPATVARSGAMSASTAAQPAPGSALADALEAAGDSPPCDECGTITVRSGTCYKCLNCGNSMGCS